MNLRRVLPFIVLMASGFDLPPLRAEAGPLAGGDGHTCGLREGTAYCWGANTFGQLGDGSTIARSSPAPVAGLEPGIQSLVAGSGHTCALTGTGAVKCWGANGNGQLGNGTTTPSAVPITVSGLSSGVIAIAAGFNHTCAVTSAGAMLCWGFNSRGQIGDGSTTDRLSPTQVTGLASGVTAIATGNEESCAVTGGAALCWGNNDNGQVGDGTVSQRNMPTPVSGLASGVTTLAAGGAFACAGMMNGAMQCWGANESGQLGDGTTSQRLTPVPVSGLTGNVTDIAAGNAHSCALDAAGALRCWGRNSDGQVGDGSLVRRLVPVGVIGSGTGIQGLAAGSGHTCAQGESGALQCWGFNGSGQVGDGTTSDRLQPVAVSNWGSGVLSIAASALHGCLLGLDGSVHCWGDNVNGELGDGSTISRPVSAPVSGLGSGIAQVDTGELHSCALTSLGGVLCWGANGNGQIGDGTTMQRLTPVGTSGLGSGIQAVAAGRFHTCALDALGGVQCWGRNTTGQLGDGSTTQRLSPVAVSGLASGVQAISAGGDHTCALTISGAVMCWGGNGNGQVGDGSTTQRLVPVPVSGLGSGVVAISAARFFTCAVLSSGAAQCWGRNSFNQLGDGTIVDKLTPAPVTGLSSGIQSISAGGFHGCAVTTTGATLCWGFNSDGRVGNGTEEQQAVPVPVIGLGSGVQTIAAGDFHTCAVVAGGRALCWGDGSTGELGNDQVMALAPRQVRLPGMGAVTPGISLRGPGDADAEDFTGSSVAIGEGASSETIIVGAPGTNAGGAVYLYLRSSSSLTSAPLSEKGLLTESFGKNIAPGVTLPPPPGGSIGDKWGAAVASSPDGTTIAVGAPLRGGAGRVFVFRMPDGGWDAGLPDTPLEILPPAPAGGITTKEFGDKLSYGADGTLIVGAPGTDVGANTGAGAAYAYLDNGKTVVPQGGGTLTATTTQTNARFGSAVATDDGLVAVGAPNENQGAETQQGAAYLFSASGGSVGSATRIQPVGGLLGDKFGTGIAVSDGTVIVGAPGDDTTAGVDSGSARVFRPGFGGIYGQVSVLLPGTGADQAAGTAVAARPGSILLGAPLADSGDKPAAGTAYLYQEEEQLLGASEGPDATLLNPTPDAGDLFGTAVAIGTRRLLIGVPGDTEPDSTGALRPDLGRTDTFILDRILRSSFE